MKVASHSITLALVVVLGSLLTSMASAQTQARMTEEALAELKRVDDQMGVIYQRIIQRYSKGADANPTLVDKLRKAQRAWIAFRDAHIAAIYQDDNRFSARAMYAVIIRTELTKTRTAQLREMAGRHRPRRCLCRHSSREAMKPPFSPYKTLACKGHEITRARLHPSVNLRR